MPLQANIFASWYNDRCSETQHIILILQSPPAATLFFASVLRKRVFGARYKADDPAMKEKATMFSFLKSEKKKSAEKVRSLHGSSIRYVTERRDDNDDVIGRGGSLSVRNEELLVFSSGEILFRFPVSQVRACDLMSGDGIVLEGYDLLSGRKRNIVAYFVYHRK